MRINIEASQEDKDKKKIKDDDLITELKALLYDDVPDFVQKENLNDIITAIIRVNYKND